MAVMNARPFLCLLAIASAASGEIHTLDQKFGGIVCDSCAVSLEKALARMRDVETARVDIKAGLVQMVLKPGNRVSLEAVRDRIKGAGFTPGEGRFSATAAFVQQENGWKIRLLQNGPLYEAKIGKGELERIRPNEEVRFRAIAAAQSDPRSAPVIQVEERIE
jgi:hypothetical protein